MKRYFQNILIGLDQFIWTLLSGDPDETISAAMWRLETDGKALAGPVRRAIDWIALKVFRQKDHCQTAYASEVLKRQLPKEYR